MFRERGFRSRDFTVMLGKWRVFVIINGFRFYVLWGFTVLRFLFSDVLGSFGVVVAISNFYSECMVIVVSL